VLSDDWASAHGLAWSPDGKEVWFTAARVGADSALNAVGLNGSERTLVPALGRFVLHDVAPDGTVLLERNTLRLEVRFRRFSDPEERDLSWLDLSKVVQLSPDASRLLFYESGQGGGLEYSAYLRATDGAVPVRVGPGRATSLSPDGRWVLALPVRASDRVDVLPTGAGEPLVVRDPGFTAYEWASWLPDGETLVLTARRGTEQPRVYLRKLSGGPPVPVTPPGVAMWGNLVSPDGSRIVTRGQGGIGLQSLRGGEPQPLSLDSSTMDVTGWGGPDTLYVRNKTRFPGQLQRFNLKTQRLEPWLTLAPPDPSGVRRVNSISVSADAAAYAYSYSRQLSDLYVVDGLR
jgi:Tol biopolymer transport system component